MRTLLAIGLLFLLPGIQNPPPSEAALTAAYQLAVEDASTPVAGENINTLTVVDKNNKGLVWNEDHSRVLVVTWKSRDSFQRFYEKQKATAKSEDNVTWVTVAPDVQKFCEEFLATSKDVAALNLRLKQYLGLNYSWNYDVFVEPWVRPADLFRPCPDPEITDAQCKLELSAQAPSVPRIKNYNAFYRNLYYKSFRGEPGVPWTGLGYTYDWGNPGKIKKGASEFILTPRSSYVINAVHTTQEYCTGKPAQ